MATKLIYFTYTIRVRLEAPVSELKIHDMPSTTLCNRILFFTKELFRQRIVRIVRIRKYYYGIVEHFIFFTTIKIISNDLYCWNFA